MTSGLILLCVLAGGLLPLQAAMNASVGAQTTGPIFASMINFSVGLAGLITVIAALRVPLPSTGQLQSVPWWAWLGGLCGIAIVMSTVAAAPKLGATLTFAAIIGGQMGVALLCDNFGWLSYQQQDVSLGRIAGAILLVVGIVLIRKF